MKRILIALFILLPLMAGCNSPVLIYEPFEAHVVDANTGEPIEGAFVVANWTLYDSWSFSSSTFKEMLEVKETMTDKNGRFAFTGFTKTNLKLHDAGWHDPQVIIFKPGYEHSQWFNKCTSDYNACTYARHTASVAGKVVSLKRLRGEESKDDKNYDPYWGLSSALNVVLRSCNGRKIPNFIVAADAERKRVETKGYKWWADLPSLQEMENLKRSCGIGREYYERYKK